MIIKKIGHCCLLIKTGNLTILTDPGNFTTEQDFIFGIDIVVITHEHADHFHVESLREVLKNNPKAHVVTNSGVGKKLEELGIPYTKLESGRATVDGMPFEAFPGKHEEIFEQFGQVQNTGYLIDGKLFVPGDSYINPNKPIDVLALPVAGPWAKISDVIRYALAVKPAKAFPIHDGLIVPARIGSMHKVPEKILNERGIRFTVMVDGDEREF